MRVMVPRPIDPHLARTLTKLSENARTLAWELERLPGGAYPIAPADRHEVALMLREMFEQLSAARELVLEECARAAAATDDAVPSHLVN